ncbi:MAG: transporter, family, 3-phenylpropionic acid transporter [Myxococcales bacterium]|jgi:PPP family 3-phenylpropionic acid transporter|nr:transporter, family, 3-phenylpropionic acid transporter [Myxococcales bacterium]
MTSPPRIRATYLFFYGAIGISLPFLAPYLRGLGFSGRQIGTAQMIGGLAGTPAGIIWAVLADRTQAPIRALRLATAAAACAAFLLPWARTPAAVAGVLVLQGLALPAIMPLVDGMVIEATRAIPGGYSRLRLFGSLGYVLTALAMGVVLTARGDRPGDPAVPLGILGCAIGYTVAARGFSAAPSVSLAPHLNDVWGLLKNRTLLWLLAAGSLHAVCTVPYHQLFGVLVRERGLPATVTGTGSTVGVIAEIAMLYFSPRIEKRFSSGAIMAAAFLAGTIRWSLLSVAGGPAVLIGLQAFHGLTFGLYWAATMRVLGRVVPPTLRTTGLAIYGAITFSLGGAIGSQLSGLAFDAFGAVPPVYRLAAVGELIPFAIALGLRRRGL